jgi:integrase
MAVKWKSTSFKGVRCYEHATRKHGVRKDLYFSIRYQKDGKRHEEGIGWASEGWTAEKAALELAKLRNASRLGEGPKRLHEKREIDQERQEVKQKAAKQKALDDISFQKFFDETYLPVARTHKKTATCTKEEGHVRMWIVPIVGSKPFKDISTFDIERIKKVMLDAGKSPRTMQHVMATTRQIWNQARRDGLVAGDSPTRSVKLPKFDNARKRFLSREEADLLLTTLKGRDIDTYRMAAISLYAGLRRAELFKLHWRDTYLKNGTICLVDPKVGDTQYAYMSNAAKAVFEEMERGEPGDLVFKHKEGPYTEIPDAFEQVVEELGFNAGIEDRRDKIVFHSLRHTYASWLVSGGVSLFQTQILMRHKTSVMTQRYAHLAPGTLQAAVNVIDQRPEAAKAEGE